MAFLALDVHVGQEVHLDLQRAVAVAGFATASFDVEREPSRPIASHLGFGRLGEERTNLVPHTGVRGRIGPWGPADGVLVDMNDLVTLFDALNPGMFPRHDARAIEFVSQHGVQNRVHQRGFARTGHAGNTGHDTQREVHIDVLEVVLPSADNGEPPASVGAATTFRHFDRTPPGDVVACDGARRIDDMRSRTGIDHFAAVFARSGADIDQPVRGFNSLLVMLDDNQGIAQIAQMMKRFDQPLVVPLVQADGRLIQHVHDPDESGAYLRGEPDALCLAAGQGLRSARQGQVAQSDIVEERETCPDLLDHLAGDRGGGTFQTQVLYPCETAFDRHIAHVGDGFAVHRHRQHFRAKAFAATRLAWHLAHIGLVILLHLVGIRLVMAAHQRTHDTFESR